MKKNSLLIYLFILIQKVCIAQEQSSLKVDTIRMPLKECIIKDTNLMIALDKMLVSLNEEPIDGMRIPYQKGIKIVEKSSFFEVQIFATNFYSRLEADELNIPAKYNYFFNYKGHQIIIMPNLENEKLHEESVSKHFIITKKAGEYKRLDFRSRDNPDAIWIDEHSITHEIVYRIYPTKMYLIKNCWRDYLL
ncbi:hypothetical protein [Edaphocola aurantiacus]|uniref:hypothetical protein n=1 Tax=Edaphocola aurantiacus TaxID=2601682 RepID=UPI001C94069A|nr:hypothetical protein [Edaphocola aurantiacus]